MDEFTTDAFANRDEPLPLIAVSQSDLDISSSEAADSSSNQSSRRDKFKRSISASHLKAKGLELAAAHLDRQNLDGTPTAGGVRQSLQDRLFSKILAQVVPTDDDVDDDSSPSTPVDRRSSKYVSRPAFSLPTMTNNFRRFNARIGIVFVFQNRMIRLFTWRTPSHTLSFLATYSFVCLDPYLLVGVPLAVSLLFLMVPAFTSRHPPPPPPTTISSTTPYYHDNYAGPALAPARTIKPASETSKDFFRNMRDLQNSMADFSNGHDALISVVAPATNFSNEVFSSQLFLYLTILTTLSFITAHLLPWRFIFLVTGWTSIVSLHPKAQIWLARLQKRAERQASQALSDPNFRHRRYIHGVPLPATPAVMQSTAHSLSAITLSSTPDTREVEIFELQHRPLIPLSGNTSNAVLEWQPHIFSSTPYDPLSPSRISGDRPRGTRFFEDVAPPDGWEWAGKKWELDLEAGEWVNERLVVGVEYDVLHHHEEDDVEAEASKSKTSNDGAALERVTSHRRGSVNLDFGGWVWDLPPPPGSGVNRDDDLWLAYGDYDIPPSTAEKEKEQKKRKGKERRNKDASLGSTRDWEEATVLENKGRTGEWRRRRWVRLVKRKVVASEAGA